MGSAGLCVASLEGWSCVLFGPPGGEGSVVAQVVTVAVRYYRRPGRRGVSERGTGGPLDATGTDPGGQGSR